MPSQAVGVIGFGIFGRFLVEQLSVHVPVKVYARGEMGEAITAAGGQAVNFAEAAACAVVIPCVPVRSLEAVLGEMAPHLQPGALVADVSSVKQIPVELMEKLVPAGCEILATHPLFGPQSGAKGLAGLPMVVWPVRVSDGHLDQIMHFLGKTLGLEVMKMAPDEHDREMAYVQALTFFLGKSLIGMNIPDTPLKTKTYQHLLDVARVVAGDSDELFETIQRYNPHAAQVRELFMRRLAHVESELSPTQSEKKATRAA